MSRKPYDCPFCTTPSLELVGRDIDGVMLTCSHCGKKVRIPHNLWNLYCEKPDDSLVEFLALVKAFNYYDMD